MILFKSKNPKDKFLIMEKRLYSAGDVADKYDILEQMRLDLDGLYIANRQEFEECKNSLKPNTWDALEELWTLEDPMPTNNVEWVGRENLTCRLNPDHPSFEECSRFGCTQCTYDEHGDPDFSEATYPGSVVDVSDLYDTLSVDNIQKRGGGPNSFQEIAQMRMAERLQPVIDQWSKVNNREADFWAWRDANDLVPHEDANCRTMRLVYRPVHMAFRHRGGVANACTVKTHFCS